jgi:hypothetical protein
MCDLVKRTVLARDVGFRRRTSRCRLAAMDLGFESMIGDWGALGIIYCAAAGDWGLSLR